jgi:diguanylate cyclase (GGDEF)-like protein
MDEVISDIREICGAEKCCILLTDPKKCECSVLCESHAPEHPEVSMISYIQKNYEDFYAIVETWEPTIAGSTCLIIQNENDMEVLRRRNPVWHHSMQAVGVRSIVLYPLSYNNRLIGYIWALNFDTDNTPKIRATLETMSYFVASEIANHQMLNRLEIMSSVDMLTGVGNRNAMNRRVDELLEDSPRGAARFAVIFADLNGLKQVNDNGGHANGDQLLKDAAAVFRNVFYDSEIYRAGGDEFMVLNTDISEEEFERRIRRLRDYSEDSGAVSFSLGSCYSAGDCDIRKAMHTADKQMYLDKKRFYENHPDRRRR